MRRALLAIVLAWSCGPAAGTGGVTGEFTVPDCRPRGDRARAPYAYDARQLATRRFENSLQIIVQEHKVNLEESDGLVILIQDVRPLLDAGVRPRPFTLPVSRTGSVSAALSLFATCPDRPTLTATVGALVLDKFTIAPDPEDTGEQEAVAGTLTATVVSADPMISAGWVRAEFDFLPARTPITEPPLP